MAKANVERESADSADSNDDDAAIFEAARPKERHLLKRMYGVHVEGHRESGESEEESAKANEWLGMDSTRLFEDDEEDARIPLRRRKSDDTVRWVEGTLGKLGTSIATAASEQSKSSASTEDGGVDADDDEESPPGQNVPLKKFVDIALFPSELAADPFPILQKPPSPSPSSSRSLHPAQLRFRIPLPPRSSSQFPRRPPASPEVHLRRLDRRARRRGIPRLFSLSKSKRPRRMERNLRPLG